MPKEDLLIMRDALRLTMLRDLRALDRQIAAYPDDESLWLTPSGISNSAGNLALHLVGNLRHFIGSALGKSGYVRDRDAEFSRKNISRGEVQAEIAHAIKDLESAFDAMTATMLRSPFPLRLNDRQILTADWLTHLAVHLTYHLGQIDYHRRLLTPDPKKVDVVSVPELMSYEDRKLEDAR